ARRWVTAAAPTSRRCARDRNSCASPAPACARRTCTTCRSRRKHRITGSADAEPGWGIGNRESISAACVGRFPTPVPDSSMSDLHTDKILILDFGSQYTQLIARRIREIGVYCEIWAWDHDPTEIAKFAPKGVILSGGPESVIEAHSPRAPEQAFARGAPVLGICYGMQTMAVQLGGAVEGEHAREFGHAHIETKPCDLFEGLPGEQDVWMSHGDRVTA